MFDPPLASIELVEEAVARVDVSLLVRLGIRECDRPRTDTACSVAVYPDRARVDFRNGPRKQEVIEIVSDFRMRGPRFVAYGR